VVEVVDSRLTVPDSRGVHRPAIGRVVQQAGAVAVNVVDATVAGFDPLPIRVVIRLVALDVGRLIRDASEVIQRIPLELVRRDRSAVGVTAVKLGGPSFGVVRVKPVRICLPLEANYSC
jgi:hypothetical protein